MMKNIKVTFSDTFHDFAGWTTEKTGRVLRGLSCVVGNHPELLDDDFFQEAFDNALKLYALTHGNLNGIYCALVYELLERFNIDGCDFLRDLINGTKNGKIMQRVMQEERDEEILKLIETNKKSNRQVLAEKLSQSDQSNLWIRNLEDELEHVHMGEETWEWFYNRHCNDRNTFKPHFEDDFIRKVYEYFQSDEYRNADADIIAGIIDK